MPFQLGGGGPGGWWIIGEPELHPIPDTEVRVPDLAGWRRERMPRVPQGHGLTVVPDWVCDILSPARASLDRDVKLPIHARHGASFAWLVDPKERTLEAYTLEDRKWREMGRLANDDLVVVAPFDAVTIQLVDLWAPA